MITLADYFDPKQDSPEVTMEMKANATRLLFLVNALLEEAERAGVYKWPVDMDTGTCISGSPPRESKSGDGGFRLSISRTGGPGSQHRKARGVDPYDPQDALDKWLDTFEGPNGTNSKLAEYGLAREAPTATWGWCHLQDVLPGSGRRTFFP